MSVRLAEAIATLSLAVDIAMGGEMEENPQVCIVAARLTESRTRELFGGAEGQLVRAPGPRFFASLAGRRFSPT